MARKIIPIFRSGRKWIQVRYISSFWRRFWKGLLIYHNLLCRDSIEGLLYSPCKFIYMMDTRIAVDIVYLNHQKEAIFVLDGLVAYKLGPYLENAFYVLVLPAESLALVDLKIGEKLQW